MSITLTLTLSREHIEEIANRVDPQSETADVRLLIAVVRRAIAEGYPVGPITVISNA